MGRFKRTKNHYGCVLPRWIDVVSFEDGYFALLSTL